ncbi:hypothetical protein [Rhodopseudomonas palustris]|nr:hypothetical protein [Rhodopseudomonas palustris]
MPTIGCFVDGYSLVLPRKHAVSYASLPHGERQAGLALAEDARERLAQLYGDFIIAEHGAADSCDLGAGCCDHAHLHLIPMGKRCSAVRNAFLEAGAEPSVCGDTAAFENYRGDPYIMLSTDRGRYEFWRATHKFGRQFVRRVCADLLGISPYFNWREHAFVDRMVRTKLACKMLLPQDLNNLRRRSA